MTESTNQPEIESAASQKTKFRIKWFIGLVMVMVLVFLGNNFIHKRNTETGNIINDALTGTSNAENPEYVELTRKLFDKIKDTSKEITPHDQELLTMRLLEVPSFRSVDNMEKIVETIKLAIDEFENFEQNYATALNAAMDQLAKDEKMNVELQQGFMEGFNESFNDQKTKELRLKRTNKVVELYNEIFSIYKYMISNFDYYVIDFNDSGDLDIYFETEVQVNNYQEHLAKITSVGDQIGEIEKEIQAYTNEKYGKYGIDAQQIYDYMNK